MLWIEFILFVSFIIALIIFVFNINKMLSKYNKKRIPNILKYSIVLLLIVPLIYISESWIHFQDQYKILKNKFALPYLIASFIPLENTINLDNIDIRLPYGYKLVNDYSAIGIIGSISKLYKDFDIRFGSSEQLGSNTLWFYNDKIINVLKIQRGGIDYIIINMIENKNQ